MAEQRTSFIPTMNQRHTAFGTALLIDTGRFRKQFGIAGCARWTVLLKAAVLHLGLSPVSRPVTQQVSQHRSASFQIMPRAALVTCDIIRRAQQQTTSLVRTVVSSCWQLAADRSL